MCTSSGLHFNAVPAHPEQPVDLDYRGIRIKVYKNGDQYDPGTVVVICRKRFKHWLTFLDFLTKKLNLMAPVHELYRTDGFHIRHFAEIEAGKSYVAVCQGPFLHKPYGSLPEDREKWNISPKFESPGKSTLDSAESVDIYLKQRGYTSRTGLPFPFDGGVCVNHSFMDVGRNRDLSNLFIGQQRDEQKSDENVPENGGVLEKSPKRNDPRECRECDPKVRIRSESHLDSDATLHDTETLKSICGAQSHEIAIVNEQNIEKNDNTLHSLAVAENGSCDEVGKQNENDCKSSSEENDHSVPVSAVQIEDTSQEVSIKEQTKLNTTQATHVQPRKNAETVITIVNEDESTNASNKSVFIFNISAAQKECDISLGRKECDVSTRLKECNNLENVNSIGRKNVDDVKISSLSVNNVTNTERSGMELPESTRTRDEMQDSCEVKRLTAPLTGNTSQSATTIPSLTPVNIKGQEVRVMSTKSGEGNEEKDENSKISSKKCSDNESIGSKFKERRKNLTNKFEKSVNKDLEKTGLRANLRENAKEKKNIEMDQSGKQASHTLTNNGKSIELSKNPTESRPSSGQRNESDTSDDFKNDRDGNKRNRPNHTNVTSQCKCQGNDNGKSDKVPNPVETQKSLINPSLNNKEPHNGKRVTLVIPPVVSMDPEMKSRETDVKEIPEEHHTVSTTKTSAINASIINSTTSSNNMNDTSHSTIASNDLTIHSTREESVVFNRRQRCQFSSETSFEPDFTPRFGRIQKNSVPLKSFQNIGINFDLNLGDIRRLPAQSNYDPDFKDFDFM